MKANHAAAGSLVLSVFLSILGNVYTNQIQKVGYLEASKSFEFMILCALVFINLFFIYGIKYSMESVSDSLEAIRSDPGLQKIIKDKVAEQLKSSKSVKEMLKIAKDSGQMIKRGKK